MELDTSNHTENTLSHSPGYVFIRILTVCLSRVLHTNTTHALYLFFCLFCFNAATSLLLCTEKTEKLNIKFRLAKENEHEDTAGERNTIRLVLEGKMEPEVEVEREAASQSQCTVSSAGENQESCSPEQKDLERGPWCWSQISTSAPSSMPGLLLACGWSRIRELGKTGSQRIESHTDWTGFSSLKCKEWAWLCSYWDNEWYRASRRGMQSSSLTFLIYCHDIQVLYRSGLIHSSDLTGGKKKPGEQWATVGRTQATTHYILSISIHLFVIKVLFWVFFCVSVMGFTGTAKGLFSVLFNCLLFFFF